MFSCEDLHYGAELLGLKKQNKKTKTTSPMQIPWRIVPYLNSLDHTVTLGGKNKSTLFFFLHLSDLFMCGCL